MEPTTSKQILKETPARSNPTLFNGDKDPVHVYCRLRPMQKDSDSACIKIISPTTLALTSPTNALSHRNNKTMEYVFKEVFPPDTNQKELFAKVALPLLEGLINGQNGLLFTYGMTGSGKTFTMTGEPKNCGILPRVLNSIFKTLNSVQALKYVIKPDKINMFEVQSEKEAMLERQHELHKLQSNRKNYSNPDLAMSSSEVTNIAGVNEDNLYAVFVTYVEIYNNSVFDLLEDGPLSKHLPTKLIRKDGTNNMYVHGATEIEIKSVEEAFEAFYLGLKRKRMAITKLNVESSRSHSIFTIRLVQAPLDKQGESIIQDKKVLTISQLSLVDLAGSERTYRTKNTGQRLREAGNINKSLMTLRTCLQILRENQINNTKYMVPYRESKITLLFQNFFEGNGRVCMVVCANPRADDNDENLQVMMFAKMASEVEVPTPKVNNLAASIGFMSGRRKAYKLFNAARDSMLCPEAKDLELDLGLVYSLDPDFSSLELNSSEATHIIKDLMAHLEARISTREALKHSQSITDERIKSALLNLEKESIKVRSENTMLKRKLADMTEYTASLKRDLQEKELLLSQNKLDEDKQKKILKTKYNHNIADDEKKTKEKHSETEILMKALEEQANQLRILAKNLDQKNLAQISDFTLSSLPRAAPAHLLKPFTTSQMQDTPAFYRRRIDVAKPRYSRSLSADGWEWIE